jgi:hypothetical protein
MKNINNPLIPLDSAKERQILKKKIPQKLQSKLLPCLPLCIAKRSSR